MSLGGGGGYWVLVGTGGGWDSGVALIRERKNQAPLFFESPVLSIISFITSISDTRINAFPTWSL